MTHYPLIVFTDFDGTITKNETLEEFVQLFMDENIQTVAQKLLDSGYSIKEGVKKIISSIPTEQYKQNRNFFQGLPIRSGFTEFVNFLHSKNIPLVVLSGGIKEMLTVNLAPYMEGILDYYAGEVDLSGATVRLWSNYETDYELVGKCEIMSLYSYDKSICIGDSYTDFRVAVHSDIIFARDRLAEKMKESKQTYFEYDTFYDIIQILEKELLVK